MQRWMWLGHGSDSFAAFTTLCTYLRSHGFTFMRTSDLYAQIVTGSST
jgi:hypothetical protein